MGMDIKIQPGTAPAPHTVVTTRAAPAVEPEPKRPSTMSDQELHRAMADLEAVSSFSHKRLRFSVNRELDMVVVKVVDAATDKVIKELPPEELQRLHLRIREALGLLFDQEI